MIWWIATKWGPLDPLMYDGHIVVIESSSRSSWLFLIILAAVMSESLNQVLQSETMHDDRFFKYERCFALLLRFTSEKRFLGKNAARGAWAELVSVVVHCGFGRARAVKTKEGREVIVSGHGTLGFLASGRLVETTLWRWVGKVRIYLKMCRYVLRKY